MDLISPKIIKEILSKYAARPSKGLGQNFLIDKNILNKIIESADIKSTDIILEVGPGLGTLTQELAKNAKKVVAIEKDKMMIEILKETLKDFKNVEVIQGDILKNKLDLPKKYKLVANIPYYLTSPLIRKFLEEKVQPEMMVLMLQKEVAQRICASSAVASAEDGKTQTRRRQGYGERGMNLLAVSVQFYAEPKIISYVSKNCFWPAPKIDSAIIKITPARIATRSVAGGPDLFFKVVKAGFSQPRKQLGNNLSKMLKTERKKTEEWLLKNNIQPNQRAETLNVENWIDLTNTLEMLYN